MTEQQPVPPRPERSAPVPEESVWSAAPAGSSAHVTSGVASDAAADPAAPSAAVHPGGRSRPGGESYASRVLRALVDFRFERSLTVESAGIIYGVWIAFVLLNWLGALLFAAIIGFHRVGGYFGQSQMIAPWLPILVLLLGWIPTLIWIVTGRIVLEFVIAGVRTARETTRTRELLEEQAPRAS